MRSRTELEGTAGRERRAGRMLSSLTVASDARSVGIYVCDGSGRIVQYNEHAASLWGRERSISDTGERFCGSLRMYRLDGTLLPYAECAVAKALRRGIPVRDSEIIIERPDGSRVIVLVNVEPLKDEAGMITGAVSWFHEIAHSARRPNGELPARQHTPSLARAGDLTRSTRELKNPSDPQAATRENEKRFRAIVETSDDAIVSMDLSGVITSWNKGAEQIFGYAAGEVIGKPVIVLIPPDRRAEELDILDRIRLGERVQHFETVCLRKDEKLIDVSLSVSPIKDGTGRVIGASKIVRDITQSKQAQVRQELLANEIHHRTKNLFAVVHAVVARSFAGQESVKAAEAAVLGRLLALAETHTMLMGKDWQGADLADVVRTEMGPYAGRVTIEGPSLILTAEAAQNFGLALHELTTNAAKYGALSNATGHIDISWSTSNANGSGALHFRWQERKGPDVAPPAHKGFGSAVLEHMMGEYFDPPPRIDFKAGGVTYELTGPLDGLMTDGGQAS
jgi:PAS domain S-box-containing protein